MTLHTPTVGRWVRYLSHGTPPHEDGSQTYPSVERPAVITEVGAQGLVGLMVVNPTGLFFRPLSEGGVPFDDPGTIPGSWHWPTIDDKPLPADDAKSAS